jgi:hypothetical protein
VSNYRHITGTPATGNDRQATGRRWHWIKTHWKKRHLKNGNQNGKNLLKINWLEMF